MAVDDNLLTMVEELEEELNAELRKAAKFMITRLALQTPKKTGEATGEWQVGINSMPQTKTGRKDLNGSKTAQEESKVIDSAKGTRFPTIYISNLAPHIVLLNDGTVESSQAPAKFIDGIVYAATKGRLEVRIA